MDSSHFKTTHSSALRSSQARSIHDGLPVDSSAFNEVSGILARAVEEGVFPGAVLLVARDSQVLYHKAVGKRSVPLGTEAPAPVVMSYDTVFDIGGVTASVATTVIFMKLLQSGKIRLDERVSNYLEGFGVHNKSKITIGQLLSHTSGLAASYPFYEELLKQNSGSRLGILTSKGARDYVINAINRSQLKYETGTKQVISEVGFILLGHLIETLTGISLDRAYFKQVLQPLGLKSTSFIDIGMMRQRGLKTVTDVIAPTEECGWRNKLLCGEVFDDNAWAMGGIAGSAGVFSTAYDLHLLCRELQFAARGSSTFLSREVIGTFFQTPQAISEPVAYYGFECPTKENGGAGIGFSENTVGATGTTGCSLWIDFERNMEIILLSNRVHPQRTNRKITTLRPELFRAVVQATVR